MKKETSKKIKSVTIDDLATMMNKGFISVTKDFDTKLDNSAIMVAKGFDSVHKELKSEIFSLGIGLRKEIMETEDRLIVRIDGLEKVITDKVLNKEPKNSEIYSLDLRVTKIEKPLVSSSFCVIIFYDDVNRNTTKILGVFQGKRTHNNPFSFTHT